MGFRRWQLLLLLVLRSTWCLPSINPNHVSSQQTNIVASAMSIAHELRSPCQFILIHDYSTLPVAFSDLLEKQEEKRNPVISLQWRPNTTFPGIPTTPRHIEYWFSWLDRPSKNRQGSCVNYGIVFMLENFQVR